MPIDIDGLGERELIELHHRIVARLRKLRQVQAFVSMRQFAIGERVAFQPRGEAPVVGTLVRHNTKSVSVVADDGRRWNVAPVLLRAVIDESGRPASRPPST